MDNEFFEIWIAFLILIILFVIVCIVVFGNSISHGEVIGENSYNYCLDECYQTHLGEIKYNSDYLCPKDKECSQCVDTCYNELKKNAPDIAKKINDIEITENIPNNNNCFIDITKE